MHCSQQSGAPTVSSKSCGDLRGSAIDNHDMQGTTESVGSINFDKIGLMGSGGLVELPTELPVCESRYIWCRSAWNFPAFALAFLCRSSI